jgi:hypothetical protein
MNHLDEFNFLVAKKTPCGLALFEAITLHHPGRRLNIWTPQHVDSSLTPSSWTEPRRFDFNVFQLRNVHTLSVAVSRRWDNHPRVQYIANMTLFLVNPPNLKHIIESPWAGPDNFDPYVAPWEAATRNTPAIPSPSESLTLLNRGRSIYLLPEIAEAAELSHLRSFDITIDRDWHHLAVIAPALVSLERLFIGVSPLWDMDDRYPPDADTYVDSSSPSDHSNTSAYGASGRWRIFTESSRTIDRPCTDLDSNWTPGTMTPSEKTGVTRIPLGPRRT